MLLPGTARKLSVPVLILALIGWIIYVVGFGLRNYRYKENFDVTAAVPDYIFSWLFLCSAPVVFALGFLHTLWENKIPAFLMYLFLPFFLVSAGAVFFLDVPYIYDHYNEGKVLLGCIDFRVEILNIQYISLEFAGTLISTVFYWVYLLMLPFFGSKYELHETQQLN